MNVLRDSLRDALTLVSKAVGASSTLPILGCVDLDADEGNLTLTTNNFEMVIRTRITARAQDPFSAAVPASALRATVAREAPG